VFLERPVVVLVSDVISQGYLVTRLSAKAYVLDVRYEKAFESDVTERVKDGFRGAKIALPFRSDRPAPSPA
jgi:small conductance mechanosensitive channel